MLGLRAGEAGSVALAASACFAAFGGLMIGQSGIEAMYFARFGVGTLPVLYLILGGTMFLTTLGFSALLASLGRGRACIAIPIALAVLAAAGRLALETDLAWVTPALWILQGVSQFVLALAVWGLAGLIADTRQAKRFFPLIGAGGVLGYVVGGLITKPLATWIGTPNLLVVWIASLMAVAAIGARLRTRGTETQRRRRPSDPGALDRLRLGLLYVRSSPLLRWLALGASLFSLLFFSLYLPFSRAATLRYPDPDELAGFFGVFFGVSTGVAFLLSMFVTNRLLTRFGVPTVLLVLPLLYVVAFGVLTVQSSFAALAVFRFAQVAWMSGGATSAWEAVINTVPVGRRDQTRAFLYGGPTQIGTILAGLIALVGERALSPTTLSAIGFVGAIAAVIALVRVRRAYPAELVRALREGRPSVFGSPDPIPAAPAEAARIGGAGVDRAAIETAVTGALDADVHVRRVAVFALGDLPSDTSTAALLRALDDDDPDVRATAIRSLSRLGDGDTMDAIGDALDDPDPRVRASAAGVMAHAEPNATVLAMLDELARDDLPDVRIAALHALRGVAEPAAFATASVSLHDHESRVRVEGVRALPTIDRHRSIEPLVKSLADEDLIVVDAAAEALGGLGADAVGPVLDILNDDGRSVGALTALRRLPLGERAGTVRDFAVSAGARAADDIDLARAVGQGRSDERLALLADSVSVRADREARRALLAASAVQGGGQIPVAIDNLSVGDPSQRATAIEVIERRGRSRPRPPPAGAVGRQQRPRRPRHGTRTSQRRSGSLDPGVCGTRFRHPARPR